MLAAIMEKEGLHDEKDVAPLLGVKNISRDKGSKYALLGKLINLCDEKNWSYDWLLKEEFSLNLRKEIQPIIHLVGPLDKAPDPKNVKIEDYYAAPLVEGKIAAGPGRIASEEIKSLVWIYAPELRSRRKHNLVAVQLAKDANSMKPTLEPGDIVLIDRDDPRSASDFKPGKIYAVRMGRSEEGCAIKRLHADSVGLIISSDNSKGNPPTRSWTSDLQKLIVGRVVWGWRNLLEA